MRGLPWILVSGSWGWGFVVVVCHAAVAFTYDMCWLCEEAVSIFEDAEGMLG
jgi:hypothetical protein